jgi:hypothetical protein
MEPKEPSDDESNTHPPIMLKKQVSGLLFADDLTAGTVASESLQRTVECIQGFFKEYKLVI